MNLFGEEGLPPDLFEEAYAEYPRKDKKIDGRKAWIQTVKTAEMARLIILDIKTRKQNNWLGKEKHWIPLFASYIRGERWTDDIYKSEVAHESKSQSLVRRQKESGERVRESLRRSTGDRVGTGDPPGTNSPVRRRPLGSK